MIEFQDDIAGIDPDLLPSFVRSFLWAQWDAMRGKRVRMKWGPFRPSFHLSVFDSVVTLLIGPRPE